VQTDLVFFNHCNQSLDITSITDYTNEPNELYNKPLLKDSVIIYSFITQNDRTHLHKIKIQAKNTNKSTRVRTVIKQLIRVFEQHTVNLQCNNKM